MLVPAMFNYTVPNLIECLMKLLKRDRYDSVINLNIIIIIWIINRINDL